VSFGALKRLPVTDYVGAISVGLVRGTPVLDLNYEEDSQAEVDMNIVMTGAGRFIELQATGEKAAFDDEQLSSMIAIGRSGVKQLIEIQKDVLKSS
jgi:ribonuclease PH